MQVTIHIYGRVQGVFFRANTQEVAARLGLKGWVKNLPDGSVEILAQGDKETLEKLVEWCKIGPAGAVVENIEYEYHALHEHDFPDFRIRYA